MAPATLHRGWDVRTPPCDLEDDGQVASYYSKKASKAGDASRGGKEDLATRRTWVSGARRHESDAGYVLGSARLDSTNGVTSTERISGNLKHYFFVSGDVPHEEDGTASLPDMSLDGGSEEEFQSYWDWNSRNTRVLKEGWIERMAHPQVNCQAYWYNHCTAETSFEQPTVCEPSLVPADLTSDFSQEGPVWTFTAPELKAIMKEGHASDFGFSTEELARRACFEFESWLPRVLSWHDYQYRCFWFFGGKDSMDKNRDSGGTAKSFFSADAEASRQLFADDAFFEACTRLLCKRLDKMHPINLTYFVWTYVRAGVVHRELLHAVAEHFCKGWLPSLDRCSLGTMLWNFSKLEFRHDRFFELSAQELYRPNRLRSLAPRNFQNSMIAYSKRKHWNARVLEGFCRGIPRLLDNHDPSYPKTDTHVLFSYTCRDGSEVPADAFRIGSLTVITKAFHDLRASGPAVEECMTSMLSYVVRSVERSPQYMREAGDACNFLRQLGFFAGDSGLDLAKMLRPIDLPTMCDDAPDRAVDQMKAALRRAGVEWP